MQGQYIFLKNYKNFVFEGNTYVSFNTLRHNGMKFIKKIVTFEFT